MLLMNNTLSSSEVDDEIAIWNNIPIETGSYTFQVPAKYTAGEGFQILFRRPYYNAREVIARSELIALVDPQAPSPSASAEPEPTDQCPGVVQRSAKRSRRSRK
jgi:hypothetical protein